MKKLLSIIGTFSLSFVAIIPTTILVVACEGKYSKEIDNILKKDVENLTGKSYFKETDVDTISLELNPEITDLNKSKDLNLIIQQSLSFYLEAKEYYDSIISTKISDWNYLVWDDKAGYGQVSKMMTYESEQNFLNFLGDAIITPDFQLATAKFAVLKNNLPYINYWLEHYVDYSSKVKTEIIDISEVKEMADFINDGYFVPFIKFIELGKSKSHGVSRTTIVFDKNLYNYINVGTHSEEEYSSIETFINENGEIFTVLEKDDDEDPSTISRFDLAQRINNYEMNKFYMYGFTLGGNL